MKVRTLMEISTEIDKKREEMVLTAQKYGYIHERTVKSSQDLDKLINEHLRHSHRPAKRNRRAYSMIGTYCARVIGKRIKISI